MPSLSVPGLFRDASDCGELGEYRVLPCLFFFSFYFSWIEQGGQNGSRPCEDVHSPLTAVVAPSSAGFVRKVHRLDGGRLQPEGHSGATRCLGCGSRYSQSYPKGCGEVCHFGLGMVRGSGVVRRNTLPMTHSELCSTRPLRYTRALARGSVLYGKVRRSAVLVGFKCARSV